MRKHTLHDPTDKPFQDLSEPNVGFISKLFVQALFPYRSTTELVRQVRQGPETITVTATEGMPYGKYPRLIMAYIVTQAYHQWRQAEQGLISKEEARRIPLGNSLNEFLRAIGVVRHHGAGGKLIASIRTQVDRLAAASIRIETTHKTTLSTRRQAVPTIDISHDHALWLAPTADQQARAESYILLAERFCEIIVDSPIPIDLNILLALTKPRAMDLYGYISVKKFWLNHRTASEWTLSWESLAMHFSPPKLTTWAHKRDFRHEIHKCLEDITLLWPDVGAEITPAGLLLHDGPLSVPAKPKRILRY